MTANDCNSGGPVTAERLQVLLVRYAAALELYARQFCRAGDDVVQEAIIELAGCREAPRDDIAWLYVTVRRKAISLARQEQRRKRRETRAAVAKPLWFHDLSEQSVDAQIAAAVLETLPAEQREVIVAHLWGGLTFAQIGRLMESSDSTAYRRYHAGLAAIRRELRLTCPKKE
jgi:RNA polymerase sigma-70 factor (ECF subfamily)